MATFWWRCEDLDLVAAQQVLKGRLGMKVSVQFNYFPVTQPSVRCYLEPDTISKILPNLFHGQKQPILVLTFSFQSVSFILICVLAVVLRPGQLLKLLSSLYDRHLPRGLSVPGTWEAFFSRPPFPATADPSGVSVRPLWFGAGG